MTHETSISNVPKVIWILWLQGVEAAPYVVRKCILSWKQHNVDWEIIILNEGNLLEYVALDKLAKGLNDSVSPQALSDIIRINLLATHGGVWVDATCFCCKPLNSWLTRYTTHEFFAFSEPGRDRPISSWFLASSRESRVTQAYAEKVNEYWEKLLFTNSSFKFPLGIRNFLKKSIRSSNYKSLRFRVIFLLLNLTGTYPYFWFHYLFALMLHDKPKLSEIWSMQSKMSANGPHLLQEHGFFESASPELRRRIDANIDPLYKLVWDLDEEQVTKGCALDYLFQTLA